VNTYKKLKEYAEQERLHIAEIELEHSFRGVSQWFTYAVLYSTDFGNFYIVSAHICANDRYTYLPPDVLEPFHTDIQKEVWGLDELEEEREARREAYRDQRRTA
jgi:hypothetical protein